MGSNYRFGGVIVGFTGEELPSESDSFLPQFATEQEAAILLEVYQDEDGHISAPVVYEDAFYRIHVKDDGIIAENSAHGTLKTWAYSILHYDEARPRLQILSPTATCTMNQILSGMMIESLLLARQHLILHASVIEIHGEAILFSAPSGTGKSTQAALWEQFRGAKILNGDKALLHFEKGKAVVSGLPFAGTSGICKVFDLPICGIVTLSQAKENRAERRKPSDGVWAILRQTMRQPWYTKDMQAAMELSLRLVEAVPVYHLACRPDEGAVTELERMLTWKTE